MASIAAILKQEKELKGCIYLHREGVFWRAYQYSAYRVLQRHAGFKVKKRFVKTVSCEVVSLGFPAVSLERIFASEELKYSSEQLICIACEDLDEAAYQAWFDAIPLMKAGESVRQGSTAMSLSKTQDAILKRIKEFRLEESTPMECMNFLIAVRKELFDYGPL